MKISVIVPAYNAELYLEESIDSILSQTYKDFEVIIVNDGSTDRTGEILERYQARTPLIKVINQENQGVARARNLGLRIARGDYIYFSDADDLVVRDALEKLVQRAEETGADLVVANYDYMARSLPRDQHVLDELLDLDVIDRYNPRLLWTYSLCNKLFKKELIDRYHMELPDISYSEDGVFVLRYIYHCQSITGLNKVVYHYRKSFDKGHDAATGIPSVKKLEDMLTAHDLIRAAARESFAGDASSTDASSTDASSTDFGQDYLAQIDRREIHFLIEQFYSKFWLCDPDLVRMISETIAEKVLGLGGREAVRLMASYPEYDLCALKKTREEALDQAIFLVALYGDAAREASFIEVLDSLISQNFISLAILLPLHMKEVAEREKLNPAHILYIDEDDENRFFYRALHLSRTTKASYIVFNNAGAYYMRDTFKRVYRSFCQKECDFLIELLYHDYYGCLIPDYAASKAFASQEYFLRARDALQFSHTLGCVFFSTRFLREFDFDQSRPIDQYFETFCRRGFYRLYDDQLLRKIGCQVEGGPEEADLDEAELMRDSAACQGKMLPWPERDRNDRIVRSFIRKMQNRPVRDKTLFLTTRTSGKLDLNAQMLYRKVKGKKVICARTGKHGLATQLRMIRQIMTSKVIITDEYNRYLRYIPLKKEQRVIQIWHACGAFKMFGRRGTPLSPRVEAASHVQYNLVCVSGPEVKEIYADAFDIPSEKVRSLGVPRTDIYFDDRYMDEVRERIFKKYPELSGKYIMLYAPTFRDHEGSREFFRPDLDFDRLSSSLPGDAVFVICPHPAMTAPVLEGSYDKIMEIRDIPTNEMMVVSQLLITDYSSVIFEYALMKKPIVFYCYDLDMYDRGFYLRYPEDLPGEVISSQDRLLDYLSDRSMHKVSEKNERFVSRYLSACDGESSQRIADVIGKYIKKDDSF